MGLQVSPHWLGHHRTTIFFSKDVPSRLHTKVDRASQGNGACLNRNAALSGGRNIFRLHYTSAAEKMYLPTLPTIDVNDWEVPRGAAGTPVTS